MRRIPLLRDCDDSAAATVDGLTNSVELQLLALPKHQLDDATEPVEFVAEAFSLMSPHLADLFTDRTDFGYRAQDCHPGSWTFLLPMSLDRTEASRGMAFWWTPSD